MRNLREYPINRTDKLVLLDEMIAEADAKARDPDGPVGGISLLILQEIKKDVEFATDEYNQRIVRDHHSASSMRSMAAQMDAPVTPR